MGCLAAGHSVGVEAVFAEEFVDAAGGYGGEELAFGIGPVVGVAGLE